MRVVLLTHYFPPEVGAPQARLGRLAEGLVGRGLEVTVHTCAPHYPDGRLAAGHRNRFWQEEARGGVRVVRSGVLPAPNRGTARRLADHASFSLSALATAGRAGPADVVVAESPPLFLATAAVPYARRQGAALVLNVSDLWPDSAIALGALRSRPAIAAARSLERAAYRGAAAITAPTAGIVSALRRRPETADKARRMAPFVDAPRFDLGALDRGEGPLRVLYAGTTGMAQGVGTLVDAARIAGPGVVRVRVAGGGAELPALRRAAAGAANVELLGVRPAEEVPSLYRDCHVAAVLLRDLPLFHGALPTKLFEAMAARRPVVVAAAGEAAELVERAGCGLVVAPGDPEALAAALSGLARADADELRAMGEAGRRAISGHTLDDGVTRWERLLREVARTDPPPVGNAVGQCDSDA